MNEAKRERAADAAHVGCFPLKDRGSWYPRSAAVATALWGRWVGSPSLAEEEGGGV